MQDILPLEMQSPEAKTTSLRAIHMAHREKLLADTMSMCGLTFELASGVSDEDRVQAVESAKTTTKYSGEGSSFGGKEQSSVGKKMKKKL